MRGNHLHLVVEASDTIALSRGMQGLAVRYVLDNHMHHGPRTPRTDTCAARLAAPRTWLLSVGWLQSRAGPLPVADWPTFRRSG